MPVIKSAQKKLRKDKIRTLRNDSVRDMLHDAIKKAKKQPLASNVVAATKLADKAAKRNIIHKNKAARIKSVLSKLGKLPDSKPESKASAKVTAKVKTAKKSVSSKSTKTSKKK